MNPIVQAYVENYDLPDLQGMLREKLAILEGRKEITGASTGGGTSYTAQETMNLKDHIACLQREVRFDHTITRF